MYQITEEIMGCSNVVFSKTRKLCPVMATYRNSAKPMRKIPNAKEVFSSYGQISTGNTPAASIKLGNISKPYKFWRVLPVYLTVSKNVLLLRKLGPLNSYFALLDTLSEKFRTNKHLANCAGQIELKRV